MKMLTLIVLLITATTNAKVSSAKDETIEVVKRMAEQGHFGYKHELAVRYERGIGDAVRNFQEAVKWYCLNRPADKNASNESMQRLEKIAEADQQLKTQQKLQTFIALKNRSRNQVLSPTRQS